MSDERCSVKEFMMYAGAVATHRIPVIDKMMAVLFALEATPDGVSVAKLSRELKISRTTVYRMLNTLAEHGVVQRHYSDAAFSLGPTLVRLARHVSTPPDIASASRPYMEDLAYRRGQTVKVTIKDGQEAVVVGVALGSGPFSIAAQVGSRFPLHAGAASKVLLAFSDEKEVASLLALELSRHTDATIVDPVMLQKEIDDIRRNGWAVDRGEFISGVRAVSVPLRNAEQRVTAALSVTFVANAEELSDQMLSELLRTADAISRSLGG
ncbi:MULTISPECIES: IclR family transcriptional regulator [unclassified Chelatococcus]|uniref:IclR family transcriptional regulator n=1 Tax=unclassified Chelatococcus TaxID=2638111 RepID=UPI001BD1685D|nr:MULTISPECIES: IclR family transcriptional regulator [unclassified Chelatococcus]MBS7700483.1 IclR family transcriptional regulator [Chelatococcus sp. YT9]MBX3556279.1 IclR family transcriptional regulator [Chelatococcus sp.]